MWCLCHSHKASWATSATTQQSSMQVTTEWADTARKTKKHTRSYSKYTHKVETYQVVYSQRLWAQDVYQLPPDSCGGWPTVNCVSDSPLLLLIVSISVPVEKWGCCGQTQAIDLQLVPDQPGARGKGWEWRPGGRVEGGLHDTPRLAVRHLEGWRVGGDCIHKAIIPFTCLYLNR